MPVERRMLFNNWTGRHQLNDKRQDYYHEFWTHTGTEAPGRAGDARKALLFGTNHVYAAISEDSTRTNIWRFTACRVGTSAFIANAQSIPPTSYSDVIQTNYQANLQNTPAAMIETPYYPEGIGTLYFDAINVTAAETNQLTIEIATNMLEYVYLGGGTTNLMLEHETMQFSNKWEVLDVLPVNVSDGVPIRYKKTLNYRGAARLRIRRTGPVSSSGGEDSAFVAVDNICVSYPPSDVVMERPSPIFSPDYPAQQEPFTIRCMVSNVSNVYLRTEHGVTGYSRSLTVHYRWRYLSQHSNEWASLPMTYVQGSGINGDGEIYQATLPAQPQVGDLEYYFVCDFGGYRYQPIDFTQTSYNFWPDSPEESEWLSPRMLRGGTQAEGGREFYTRLRPYPSPYGTVSVVTGPVLDENPVPMTLISNNVWRGMIPLASGGPTNLQFYFRGENKYDPDSQSFLTHYWVEPGQALTGIVPFGGVCGAPSLTRPADNVRISVTAQGGGFVQVVFNADTREYMTSRAEYQNFNLWAAPSDVFTDSNGQVSKQRFPNTFDSWPSNGSSVVQEYFKGWPSVTNEYSVYPYNTFNGWLSSGSAYVVDRLRADNFNTPDLSEIGFRNVAIRLKGGAAGYGLGYIHNQANNTLQDGIDRISFKGRLGQEALPHEAIYYTQGFLWQNYLVRANVGADDLSPQEPSLSVLGYYQDYNNFYEYRMTQVPNTANLNNDRRIRHELYRWRGGVPVLLKSATLSADLTLTTRTQVELRMYTALNNTTTLNCKFGTADNVLQYTDSSMSALTRGTCGFLSAECRSGFGEVFSQPTALSGVNAIAVAGSPSTVLMTSTTFATDIQNWSFAPAGRWAAHDNFAIKGIYTVIPTQKLGVFLQKTQFGTDEPPQAPGTTAWTLFNEVTLTGFGYQEYDAPVYAWRSHFLMLQPIGRTDGQRVDVIVDEINLSGWRGQQSSDFSIQDSEGDNRVRASEWAATEAWVVSREKAGLNEGRVPGAFNITQKSPMTSIQLSTRYANTDEGWLTNTTYIYSGRIKLDGAGKTNYFAENFIGSVRLSINGDVVLNSTDPYSASTNTVVLDSGWYSFELRLGCGSVQVGPAGGGVIGGLGVAYSRDKGVSWVEIKDPGNGSFLLAEEHTISLDHLRGGRVINSAGVEGEWLDQAVRSPLLERGVGMLEFDYMVHRPPAKLTVQFASEADDSLWHDIRSIVVTEAMTNFKHELVYLGTNVSGYLRVLNERSAGYTNAWVSIDNAVAWDEPVVGDADWRAYNVKVTDTDPQRVMIDESKACFLNNSQTEETDPHQTLYPEAYVKTPLLPTGIGTLTFMARVYTDSPPPPTLHLYVTTHPAGPRAADPEWTLVASYSVTNMLYDTYRFQPPDGRAYRAAKLVVPTTGGGQRVCIEELAVTEPVLPGFEIVNVRALCAEGAGFSEDRFQPLHSDEVGFEARLSNIRLSPQNIRLYVDYYVGTNVWGVENWPAGEVKRLEMEPVADSDIPHLYRTDIFNVVPAQEKNQVVQYRVRATYEDANNTVLEAYQSTFDKPSWYDPVDLNQRFASTGGWTAYYIVYDVPVGAVWLNEINVYEEASSDVPAHSGLHKYVEIAVPAEVSLSGWHLDIVPLNDYEPVYTITFLGDLPTQQPVTNGYAFFVVGQDPYAQPSNVRNAPPLPKLDYSDLNFASKFQDYARMGIRLRRPWGMYEHAVVYDRVPHWGSSFSGSDWVAEHPGLGFQYVGKEDHGGSLNVVTNSVRYGLPQASDWAPNLLAWTPGGLNVGQTVEHFDVLAPGVSNVVVRSVLSPMHGVQNEQAVQLLAFKLRLGTPTNIVYKSDDWYRIKSVKVNGVEHLSGGEVDTFDLPLLATEYADLNVVVTFGIRQDVGSLNLGSEILTWLMSFGDAPLAPTYYYGRELELYERYWLNANPTTTNYLEGGIIKVEREDATTNYFMTAWLALNGTNVSTLLGDHNNGDAVFKIEATDSLTKPDWTMLAQYKLTPTSFDDNHTTRVFIQNPFLQTDFSAAHGGQLFFRWVIEYEDPRFSKPPLVSTNSP
ncbi:MAG TPA: hypothetical protein P5026_07630 [Kiritimatiellia bacterium]|nr:hypothetical protein [Kiritimatiellia bacterium]